MGKRKIIVSERDNLAAVFENDVAIEFISHRGDMLLGDVYLATVENILPSIDAAFVNVGGDKMGFLHSSDAPGKGDLKMRLQPKQQLVVQVMKEPTGHKGPRVTTNISLPGRFLVLMPESRGISISRKIEQQAERARLKSTVSLIKPTGVGIILRTEAEHQKEEDIQEDFEILMERWQNIVQMADTSTPPTLLYRDQDLLYRVIREAVTDDVEEMVVDTTFGQQRAQQLLQNWNMDKGIKVSLYTGNQSILLATGVDREIKQALQNKVPMPSGGYLYIQPTEALCVVDVNSGKFTSLQSQAETIKHTNLEACKEIARQLRLRNIGGMIIVDFIDMESRADQLAVLQAFENELAPDKAKPQIGQISDLGLVEMTRHRQGQALSEIFTRKCMACNGTGHVLEDLHWAPPNLDSAVKSSRPGSMRNSKLPIRQQRPSPNQQVPKPAAGNRQSQAAQLLTKVMEPVTASAPTREAPAPGTLLMQARQQQTATEQQPQREQRQGGNGNNKSKGDDFSIADYFRDKMFKETAGLKLSNIVRFACPPPGPNSILSRINPKANNIFTLVASIESGGIGYDVPEMDGERAEEGAGSLSDDESRQDDAAFEQVQPSRDADDDSDDSDDADDDSDDDSDEPEAPDDSSDSDDNDTDSDNEDEDEDDAEPDEAPKKPIRRRGRPPKRLAGVKQTTLKVDDAETDSDSDADEPESEEAEAKPRRRRGRPPKAKPAETESDGDDDQSDND